MDESNSRFMRTTIFEVSILAETTWNELTSSMELCSIFPDMNEHPANKSNPTDPTMDRAIENFISGRDFRRLDHVKIMQLHFSMGLALDSRESYFLSQFEMSFANGRPLSGDATFLWGPAKSNQYQQAKDAAKNGLVSLLLLG